MNGEYYSDKDSPHPSSTVENKLRARGAVLDMAADMTLRDVFASSAFTAYVNDPNADAALDSIATWAYKAADAMMKAREVGK